MKAIEVLTANYGAEIIAFDLYCNSLSARRERGLLHYCRTLQHRGGPGGQPLSTR